MLGLLVSGRREAASDRASLQERLAVTQQLTEVLLQALLQPSPVRASPHCTKSMGIDSFVAASTCQLLYFRGNLCFGICLGL